MDSEAMSKIKDRYKILVAKILLEKFAVFSDVRSLLSVTTKSCLFFIVYI
jgi:DNA-binding HxlR family transcriptional regulator